MLLYSARNVTISKLTEQLPTRYTYSDRLQNVDGEKSYKLISLGLENQQSLLKHIGLGELNTVFSDTTDGLRITLNNGSIVHIRPSGNAPELRCYAEADSLEQARHIVDIVLESIKRQK